MNHWVFEQIAHSLIFRQKMSDSLGKPMSEFPALEMREFALGNNKEKQGTSSLIQHGNEGTCSSIQHGNEGTYSSIQHGNEGTCSWKQQR